MKASYIIQVTTILGLCLSFIEGFRYIHNAFLLKSRISSPLSSNPAVDLVTSTDTMPKLKVLLVVEPTPFSYISGYKNRFQEMLKCLANLGDRVHIITPDESKEAVESFSNFSITNLSGFRLFCYKDVTLSLDSTFQIPRVMCAFDPDLVHIAMPSVLAFPAMFWAKWFRKPIVMSYHTNLLEYAKTYFDYPLVQLLARLSMRLSLSAADLVLTTSPQLREHLLGLGVQDVDVWRKGVNVESFHPTFSQASMRHVLSDGHPEAPLLLYVGRLGKEKRLHRLRALLEACPGARLAVVGSGPFEEELRELLSGMPVKFMGSLTGGNLSAAYASSDCFVMPSDTETLGFVVLEAMASGLPVVGVAAGGLLDLIAHNETGYLCENEDNMRDFSEQTRGILASAQLRHRLGVGARRRMEGLGWEQATQHLRQTLYPKAMRKHVARNKKLFWGISCGSSCSSDLNSTTI